MESIRSEKMAVSEQGHIHFHFLFGICAMVQEMPMQLQNSGEQLKHNALEFI